MADLPWLRLYSDAVDNEKLRLLAFEDRWHFIAILCCKRQGIIGQPSETSQERHTLSQVCHGDKNACHSDKFNLMERKIAVKLGVTLEALIEIKQRLVEVELIDDQWQPVGWDTHQYESDSSAERTRKYRENKKKLAEQQANYSGNTKTSNTKVLNKNNETSNENNETSQERHSDGLDTDTNTDIKETHTNVCVTRARDEENLTPAIKKTGKKNRAPPPYPLKFVKPTLVEVEMYCRERNNSVNAMRFVAYYEANGWIAGGRTPMQDWKAAIVAWEERDNKQKLAEKTKKSTPLGKSNGPGTFDALYGGNVVYANDKAGQT